MGAYLSNWMTDSDSPMSWLHLTLTGQPIPMGSDFQNTLTFRIWASLFRPLQARGSLSQQMDYISWNPDVMGTFWLTHLAGWVT